MATQRMLRFLAAAGAFCLLIGLQVSFADSHVRIVRLSEIEGGVQIDRNTGQGFEKAIMNMPITEGMRIKTTNGRAEVEFENGSVVRLADDSSVDFSQLTRNDEGAMVNDVRLDGGTIYVHYKHKEAGAFKIEFAKDALSLDHDVHFRLSVYPDTAQIAVLKGELEVPENGLNAKLKKDQTLNFNLEDQRQTALAKGITSLPSDHWDSERTAYDTQYKDQYAAMKSPYQYGYTDLNYYGTFFNAPGYGLLWQPFGVGMGWDPFADGAWAFYPGMGYTWVSGYPWGWTPYRYGTWVYGPAYGWAWQPGGWNTINTFPTVAHAPLSWHHPMPPTAGTAVVPGAVVPATTAVSAMRNNSTVMVGNVGNPAMIHAWRRVALYQQPNAAMTTRGIHMAPMAQASVVQNPATGAAVRVPAYRGAYSPEMRSAAGGPAGRSASAPSAPASSAPSSAMRSGSSGGGGHVSAGSHR